MARYQKGNPEFTAPRPDAWQSKAGPRVEIWGWDLGPLWKAPDQGAGGWGDRAPPL